MKKSTCPSFSQCFVTPIFVGLFMTYHLHFHCHNSYISIFFILVFQLSPTNGEPSGVVEHMHNTYTWKN